MQFVVFITSRWQLLGQLSQCTAYQSETKRCDSPACLEFRVAWIRTISLLSQGVEHARCHAVAMLTMLSPNHCGGIHFSS